MSVRTGYSTKATAPDQRREGRVTARLIGALALAVTAIGAAADGLTQEAEPAGEAAVPTEDAQAPGAGTVSTGNERSEGPCLYRTNDERHETKWGSCTVPPPRASLLLMDPRVSR